MVGATHKGAFLRPLKAAQSALATCSLGLSYLMEREETKRALPEPLFHLLRERSLVELFQIGHHLLFEELSLYTSHCLVSALYKLSEECEYEDLERSKELIKLARIIKRNLEMLSPWKSANEGLLALHVIWDDVTIDFLQGLLERCPLVAGDFLSNYDQLLATKKYVASLVDEALQKI